MLINLPTSRGLRASKIASWMIYPDVTAESERAGFYLSLARCRYLNSYATAMQKKPSQPYIWDASDNNELILIANPNIHGDAKSTPILADDNGALLSTVSEMLASNSDTHHDRQRLNIAYRKGYISGAVLLACYIFDSNRALGHKSSKARGVATTATITSMKKRSIETFFREYNSVAHFWAAYHLCSEGRFIAAHNAGILNYTNNGIHPDFLDDVDIQRLINTASQLASYGASKNTDTTSLLDGTTLVEIPAELIDCYRVSITKLTLEVFLNGYPSGKRDTRL